MLRGLLRLPFRWRVAVAGWVGDTIVARFSRMPERVQTAVQHFLPELPASEAKRIGAEVPGNFARMIIEILSADELAKIAATLTLEGPGLAALDEAHAQGRAVILASAHLGNYDVWRLALIARGFKVGGYFNQLGSPGFNDMYLRAVSTPGAHMFPNTSDGRKSMIRFLRSGGMLGIGVDLDRTSGVLLDFLGQPTRTVLSMAEMALKYDAALVPIYGIRTKEQPGFRIWIDAAVPHGDPMVMTQALNDSLGAQVRAHPEQWVYWHNRRKQDHPDSDTADDTP